MTRFNSASFGQFWVPKSGLDHHARRFGRSLSLQYTRSDREIAFTSLQIALRVTRVDSLFTAPPRADSRFSLATLLLHIRARSVAHRSPLGRPRLERLPAVPRGALHSDVAVALSIVRNALAKKCPYRRRGD